MQAGVDDPIDGNGCERCCEENRKNVITIPVQLTEPDWRRSKESHDGEGNIGGLEILPGEQTPYR